MDQGTRCVDFVLIGSLGCASHLSAGKRGPIFMLNRHAHRLVGLCGAAALCLGLSTAAAAAKDAAPGTVYVASTHSSVPGTSGCSDAGFSTISAAVAAASPGGTIVVCPGTYEEDVTVEKSLTLEGIDATVAPGASASSPLTPLTGGNNGFTILSPYVTVKGFKVVGAASDGIMVVGDNAMIEDNMVVDNGRANPDSPGNGINLDGSSYSTVVGNTVSGSGNGGIQLANDPDALGLGMLCAALGVPCDGITGTATHDRVLDNNVNNNPFACGILLVDHAGTDGSVANQANGVYDNVVRGNLVQNNAMQGYGAGILLASSVPGGAVYDNLIQGNRVSGNGLAGLTLHAHIGGANQDLNGNVIVGNDFGTNNLKGLEPSDLQTTGVFIGSQDHLDITVAH